MENLWLAVAQRTQQGPTAIDARFVHEATQSVFPYSQAKVVKF
jgi:hypothetical protein